MSNWEPVKGKGNEIRRSMVCYGKPPVMLAVSRIPNLLGYDYAAIASCAVANGSMVCSAMSKSVNEAKRMVVADALGKYARHMAVKKMRKDARSGIRRGSVARELVGVGVEEGGEA